MGLDAAPQHRLSADRSMQARVIRARLPVIPARSSGFHGIFCECVLSLVPDKKRCLAEFFRILKPGGKLVVSDLYLPKPVTATGRFTGSQPLRSCLEGALSVHEMARLTGDAGFDICLMEDHTRALHQMVGQLIFDHGSLDGFRKFFPAGLENGCQSFPGYGLMIATKNERH